MRATLRISGIPIWSAYEKRSRRRRAHETVPPRQTGHRRRGGGRGGGPGSQSGGVRAFSKLLPLVDKDARIKLCHGLVESEDKLYGTLRSAVKSRDLYTIDKVTEELKWVIGSSRSCRLR